MKQHEAADRDARDERCGYRKHKLDKEFSVLAADFLAQPLDLDRHQIHPQLPQFGIIIGHVNPSSA